ncbi:MAG: hypothetical protein HETSPECPRED_000084 [Heterodermia speciosa]|uniref:Uncharacterized protein n=1 Tax=Heterodermia speciosa TaxID=116794 RepID=A0A8H3EDA9_9LECA|nr:MAG: hypothetical protein HETSPECPRED_000084 [Heterodermia speciosa]
MAFTTQLSANASISNSFPFPFALTTFQTLFKRQYDDCAYCVATWPTGGTVPDIYTMSQACNSPAPAWITGCPNVGIAPHLTPMPTRPGHSALLGTPSTSVVSNPGSSAHSSSSVNSGTIIALAVVCPLLFCVIVGIVLYMLRRHRQNGGSPGNGGNTGNGGNLGNGGNTGNGGNLGNGGNTGNGGNLGNGGNPGNGNNQNNGGN